MNHCLLQKRIDQYIDGQLAAEDLTDLLNYLESADDGWKSCAMRLIEARELKHVLRDLVGNDEPVMRRPTSFVSRGRLMAYTCAAALMTVAFFGGRLSVPDITTNEGLTVEHGKTDESAERPPAVATVDKNSSRMSVVGIARIHHLIGTGPAVPVIAGPKLDFDEILRQLPTVPEDVRRRAGNRGLRVEPERQVMSLELADGQRFAVPLDSVGLRYVGHSVL